MSPIKHQARFLPFQLNDAASNMAIDEAILEAHSKGIVPITLRLYGFRPSAISIGYGQKLSSEAAERIRTAGLDLVRRPTGGRAVLHLNDLTYSFVGSIGGPAGDEPANDFQLNHSIIGAYKQICKGLIMAMSLLGIEVEMGQSKSNYRNIEDCFAATTAADLHYRGEKLIGSAQLRRNQFLLQHGSLVFSKQPISLEELLSSSPLALKAIPSISRLSPPYLWQGQQLSIEELESAFRKGFEQARNLDLKISGLTSFEMELAANLTSTYFKCA